MSFLDAIVQTEEGIIQLIAVERIREAALGDYILDQGTPPNPHPLKADTAPLATGGFKSRRLRIRDRSWDGR